MIEEDFDEHEEDEDEEDQKVVDPKIPDMPFEKADLKEEVPEK